MRATTRSGWMRGAATAALAAAVLLTGARAAQACAGDCNGNDAVAVNEVVTLVNVSLETRPLSACPAGDVNGNGAISIDEIMTAVGFALEGCAATPALQPCTGADLTTCSASCGGPGRDGCCPLTSPPACFDPSNGSIQSTLCGPQPSAACVLGSAPTPTYTIDHGATPTVTPPTGAKTQVTVNNHTTAQVTVYVNFGADSAITQGDWASFCSGSGLSCQFTLFANGTQTLPNPNGAYLNATFAFNSPVGCNATKAEVNVNNPTWYDILDVSLVDGYSNNVAIVATPSGSAPITLGPPNGESGNEAVYGLYPYGCDVCVARCSPPCGIAKSSPLVGCDNSCNNCQSNGVDGCKAGTQSAPAVPCQYQGPVIGGGGQTVQVVLMN